MTTSKISSSLLAVCASVFLVSACGGDDDGGANESDAGADLDGSVEFVCDPEGAFPAMGALLNAPVDSDVEVISKEPQHPGDPGPESLP